MVMALSVRRSLGWMTLSQGSLFVLQFGTTLVIARLLTPYEMGVFAVAVAVVGLLSLLRTLGLSSYLVRAAKLDEAMLATTFTINAAIAALISILIVGLSAVGEAALNEPGVQRLLLVMALLPLIGIFEFLPAAGIEREGNFRIISWISIIRSIVSNAIILCFAFAGFSYMSLAYGQIASSLVGLIAINVVGRRHVRLRLGFFNWREIMKFGLHMLAISGVSALTSRLAELLMGHLLGLSALGIYSRASGLNGMLWENVHIVVARVVFVDFSEQRRKGIALRASYLRIVQVVTALLWPAFAGMAVIAGPLVMTLYGSAWIDAALPLSLLSISAIVLVSITMTWEIFVVCEETGRQARFEFMRASAGLVMFAAGCWLSLTAAAVARVGEAIFAVMLYRPHLERMTGTQPKDFTPIYVQSAALTLLAIAPAIVTMTLFSWSPEVPIGAVACSVFLGVVAWLAGLFALRHPVSDEIRTLVSRILPGRTTVQT